MHYIKKYSKTKNGKHTIKLKMDVDTPKDVIYYTQHSSTKYIVLCLLFKSLFQTLDPYKETNSTDIHNIKIQYQVQ